MTRHKTENRPGSMKNSARLILGLLLLTASLNAFAQSEPRFPELTDGPWTADVKSKIQKAVFRIQLNKEDTNHCSAVFIDNKGTALTALHCLKTCLQIAENWNASKEGWPPVDLATVPNQAPKALFCPDISIAGAPTMGSPEILFAGWGLIAYSDRFVQTFPQILADLKTKGWSAKDGDFAVIRFSQVKSDCLKVSRSRAQDLWLAGFPMLEKKAATTMKISSGKAYSRVTDSIFYRKNNGPSFSELYDRPGIFISSASNQFGFSGSPSLNRDGEIVGVNSSLMMSVVVRDAAEVEVRETQSIEIDYALNKLKDLGFSEPVCNN